ncbi:MAG: septal ring lytic transglycosylase RlpA family protein [Verrucomicrobiales bacterium]
MFFIAALGSPGLHAQSPENGSLSVYLDQDHGRTTASGEIHDANALTAAHESLPFGSIVRVANFDTGRMVDVRINDRKRRDASIVNLSKAAADRVGLSHRGTASGSLMVVGKADAPTHRPSPGPPNTHAIPAPGVSVAPAPPSRFQPFAGFGKNDPVHDAVAGSRSAPANEKTGLFGRNKTARQDVPSHRYESGTEQDGLFARLKAGAAGLFGKSDAAPRAGYAQNGTPPPAASYAPPSSAMQGELIPMNATVPASTAPPIPGPGPVAARESASRQTEVPFPYRAQFGAFSAESNAHELAATLGRSGVGTTVAQSSASGLHLVLTAGGFRTAEDAQQWIDRETMRRGWRQKPLVTR